MRNHKVILMTYMIYRVKQFFRGLAAYIPDKKMELVDYYLTQKEKDLFNRLPLHEKKHAVNTAWTIYNAVYNRDKYILVKAALLHDIGKVQGKLGIIKKSILVLMDRFLPRTAKKLSNKLNMFYLYYNHPEIGAKLLRSINTNEQVVMLVKYHHSSGYNYIEGMDILKEADSLN